MMKQSTSCESIEYKIKPSLKSVKYITSVTSIMSMHSTKRAFNKPTHDKSTSIPPNYIMDDTDDTDDNIHDMCVTGRRKKLHQRK